MPSGRVHAAAVVAQALAGALVAVAPDWQAVVAIEAGMLTGLLVGPDLDVDAGNISRHYVRRRAGPVVAALWGLFWLPYAVAVRHRSPLSHAPLIGTVGRLAYIVAAVWIVCVVAGVSLPPLHPLMLWYAGGLAVADVGHYLLDRAG